MLTLDQKKVPSNARAVARPVQHRTLPHITAPVIQRAPSCACGGWCPRCQAKSMLRIGAPDDAYEREADAAADRVMRMEDGAGPVISASSPLQRVVQRRATNMALQRELDSEATTNPTQLDQTPEQCQKSAHSIYKQCMARCKSEADSWACALPWRDCPTEYTACTKKCSEEYDKALNRCAI